MNAHQRKGTKVKNHENPAKKPQTTSGIRATLRAFLRPDATRASKIRLLVSLAATTAFFAFAAPALAIAPTVTSEFTSPTANPSTEVNLEAAVNPNNGEPANEATTCEFQYGETVSYGHEAPCTNPENNTSGTEQRATANVTGLKAGTTYHWRVVLENASGKAEGPDAEVTTAAEPPEAPETTGSKSVTATSAVLEGVLNPHSTAKAGWYFAYTTEPVCVPTLTSPLEGEETVKAKPKHVEVKGLEPNREYTFCMVATDEGGAQATPSATELKFTTKPAPPTVGNEGAGADSSEATLFATVNPNNEETKYFFEYSTTGTAGAGGSITGTVVKDPSTPGILPEAFEEHQLEISTGAVLEAGKIYYYRVVAENAQSEKEPHPAEGEVQSFTTVPTPTTDPVSAIEATTATFNGHLTPLNSTTATQYHFDYKLSGSECTGESETAAGEAGKGTGGASEATPVTGLQPDRLYTVCLVTANAFGSQVGPSVTFRTLPETSSTDIAASSATMQAVLDPEGESTTYDFQYGTSTEYGSETTVASAEGSEPVSVEAHIQELTPGSVYHFHVIATDAAHETIASADATFTTQPAATASTLPDNRQYEMVSPPDKHGALIYPIFQQEVLGASADGGAFTYLTSVPIEANPRGYSEEAQVLATRGPDGWSDQDIGTPHDAATGVPFSEGSEYQFFSPDLSRALVAPPGAFTALAAEETFPQASESTLYVRASSTCQAMPATCYTPLVTKANTPPGTMIEGRVSPTESKGGQEIKSVVEFVGATPDLSHVLLTSSPNNAREGQKAPALTEAAPQESLYEWTNGQLQLVNVLPENEEGGAPVEGTVFADFGDGNTVEARNAISEDGSRIVWSTISTEHLYMRDTALGDTVRLDLPEPECLGHSTCGALDARIANPYYDMASSDGSRVFFTDMQRLTADSRAGEGEHKGRSVREPDLYVCQMVEVQEAGHTKLKCDVTDLTPDSNPDGESAAVQGSVLSVSKDGSYVYFVANGVLGDGAAHGATPGDCEYGDKAERLTDTCNLYVEHYDGETAQWEAPVFIATLSGTDKRDWEHGNLKDHTSQSSPDGRYLAFMSRRSLTGYDNLDASEHPTKEEEQEGVSAGTKVKHYDEEVYLYDAVEHRLVCASCSPSGARPAGEVYAPTPEAEKLVGGWSVWEENTWLAANVPGWTPIGPDGKALYQSRYLSDSGRLFFNSHDALVPSDVNGTWDVYEYEPPAGAGGGTESDSCTTSTSSGSVVFSAAAAGCVGLISSGESSEESAFLDASESGDDIFFLTASQLVSADIDHSLDVYDAHVCGAEGVACTTSVDQPPPCTTEASCKPAPEPQPSIYGAPASATFSGPGNLAPPAPSVVKKVTTKRTVKCKKGYVKKKVKKKETCVKKKSKKSAHKSAKARH
jgi:hypothetical protein